MQTFVRNVGRLCRLKSQYCMLAFITVVKANNVNSTLVYIQAPYIFFSKFVNFWLQTIWTILPLLFVRPILLPTSVIAYIGIENVDLSSHYGRPIFSLFDSQIYRYLHKNTIYDIGGYCGAWGLSLQQIYPRNVRTSIWKFLLPSDTKYIIYF